MISAAENGWEVPTHRVTELRARATRYAVCIPVINEGERIRKQLTRMRPFVPLADVIVADGGSTDGSVAAAALDGLGVRTVLVKTGPGRLSAQMRMAMAYALGQGYEGVIFIDGNDKDDPGALPLFMKALDEGIDHVQGSRFVPGGHHANTPVVRLLGIHLLHAPIISLAARHRYTDTTNGFRAYSRRLLLDPRVAPFRDVFSSYELHYYLAIRAARLGLRCAEVPVTRSYPARGRAPTKISPVRGSARLFGTLLAAAFHRFDPPSHAGEERSHG